MRAVVVYESIYGNSHHIAAAIGDGLRAVMDVEVCSVHDVDEAAIADVDLLVVGGPTHAHGMSRTATRKSAVEVMAQPENTLELDPDSAGASVREWLESLPAATSGRAAAAFDTRVDMMPLVTGRASRGIAKGLRGCGYDVVVEPESFLVDRDTDLEPGEEQRATAWGAALGAVAATR